MVITENEEAKVVYQYIADFAKSIYEGEEKREASVIEQAGRMQSAFSFVIAALFMLAQILVAYTVLSSAFLIASISSVSITLLLSLLFATIAQRRFKRTYLAPAKELSDHIKANYQFFLTSAQRNKNLSETYEEISSSLEKKNNTRIVFIQLSMGLFYFSLGLCLFWFGFALIKYRGAI